MTVTQDNVSLTSVYVPAQDGTKLAVDIWLPAEFKDEKLPTIFTLTRYWRSFGFKEDILSKQLLYKEAREFTTNGYAFVVADARGSGASFGTRDCEISKAEINDIKILIEWTTNRPWSNGKVASTGTSYTAHTAIYCASDNPQALKVIVPFAVDFDTYDQLICPGGMENNFTRDWGTIVSSMDQNDFKTLSDLIGIKSEAGIIGVRPVDGDMNGSLLAAAVKEHASNFGFGELSSRMAFRDHPADVKRQIQRVSVYHHKEVIEASKVPIHYRTGWLDAGTPQGALNLFNTFSNPMQVIIGPWSHGNYFRSDPYITDEPVLLPIEEKTSQTMSSLAPYVTDDKEEPALETGVLEYYTFTENTWKTTCQWPLPETRMERFYLNEGLALSTKIPDRELGQDLYKIDLTATTGKTNRWHTQLNGGPVLYPNRHNADKKLLVYTTQPLTVDTEVTGHPKLLLFVASNREDGDFIVYLEDVAPDGTVYCITEGCLRACHRKVSTPPYAHSGIWHSCCRKDAEPMVPETVTALQIGLIPTSVLFQKGHRIRLAIAGADKDTFISLDGVDGTQWRIQRNSRHPSCLELPIIPR